LSVENADVIFVLKDGSLVETGNHEDLMQKNGLYKNLWNKEKKEK